MSVPIVKDVVLVGGGHSHALLLRRWGMAPVPGARLTVINPAPTAPYTGMLPGFIAGHYTRDELEIDLVKLARFAGARLILGMVDAIDPEARTVTVAGRPLIPFDLASIDIGITSEMPEIPGFEAHGTSAKPLGPYAARWQRFLEAGGGDVAVIGGGVAGVELALAMHHALAGRGQITIIEASEALSRLAPGTTQKLKDRLRAADITLLEHQQVAQISAGAVTLKTGQSIPAALVVGAAGARPFPWLSETGLTLENGFIAVDDMLRSLSHPHIYAAGDCAHLTHAPRPKAGVFAVRAAPILTHNLKADLTGGSRRSFKPQSHYLKLVSLGPKEALADKWGRALSGAWAWRWKDRIDRSFMDRLNHPPTMPQPPLPKGAAKGVGAAMGPKPLCAGCGSKVGPVALDRALATLPAITRPDVLTKRGDDAALLQFGETTQALSTDHIRAFWNDPWIMGKIAAVHALNDILAMGAEPQAALAQIILPPASEAIQSTWLSEVLQGATDVFNRESVALAGGHSSVGGELTIGFTVTGLSRGQPLTQGAAKAGDQLILTAPIGSGTILAAEMQIEARGRDMADLLQAMAHPRGPIARALWPFAGAMTDVTGFGLGGHAARIADMSGLSVALELDRIPIFSGAAALAEQGHRSSIWDANRAAVSATLPPTPRAALLFDPQTAGGFLASVPAEHAEQALQACRDAGADAHLIGEMLPKGAVTLKAE